MISDNWKHFDWSLNRENHLIHLHGEFNDWLDIEQLWNDSLIKFQRSIGYCQRMSFITHEYFELLFFFPMIFWNIFFILLMSPENLECKGLCISSFGNSKITSIRTFPWEETWWKLRKSCITLIHKFLQENSLNWNSKIEITLTNTVNLRYLHQVDLVRHFCILWLILPIVKWLRQLPRGLHLVLEAKGLSRLR